MYIGAVAAGALHAIGPSELNEEGFAVSFGAIEFSDVPLRDPLLLRRLLKISFLPIGAVAVIAVPLLLTLVD